MPWISKDSANTTIERRDEPYLTEAMIKTARETYLPRYETKQAATLPVLHMIQHTYGWIPHQAIEEVAEFLELTPGTVLDTASFYEEFWLKQKGKHTIAVCRSIACEVCDHAALTNRCREKLNIEIGETTDDGVFTLIELECLGACGGAPAALIDETLHETVTPEQLNALIDGARKNKAH